MPLQARRRPSSRVCLGDERCEILLLPIPQGHDDLRDLRTADAISMTAEQFLFVGGLLPTGGCLLQGTARRLYFKLFRQQLSPINSLSCYAQMHMHKAIVYCRT